MSETLRFVGTETVVEAGSVILWSDDPRFTIRFSGLNFTIETITDHKEQQIQTKRISTNELSIKINLWQQAGPSFKFKVGSLLNRELSLALYVAPIEAGRYVLTYTFSTRGS